MLRSHFTPGSNIEKTTAGWHLQIPAGESGEYCLAQLDNYPAMARKDFPLSSPVRLNLSCRASSSNLAGTWGFGFWNDPFPFSLGLQGMARRLPALPNSCWFFNSSRENHLSFNDQFAGNGFLAQTFRSPKIPSLLLLPGLLIAPMLFIKMFSKRLRSLAGKVITEDSQVLDVDTTDWHAYNLSWNARDVVFRIDDSIVFQTNNSPRGPLGIVIWIDNQYAAWTSAGKLGMGTLRQVNSGWIDIEKLEIKS
jgi:hypothetical protein